MKTNLPVSGNKLQCEETDGQEIRNDTRSSGLYIESYDNSVLPEINSNLRFGEWKKPMLY